ncbi:MAG: molecular chaperone DnaJ [Desulforhopalus sp.]|nr:molecular chaperone DnaJ [Desulforhopalus sp.]
MNVSNSQRELFRSCEILFGDDLRISGEFLHYLQISGVKSAFRKRAMETHPDTQMGRDLPERQGNTEPFSTVRKAYENLLVYLREKESLPPPPAFRASVAPSADKTTSGRYPFDYSRQRSRPVAGQTVKPIILTGDIQRTSEFSSTERYYQGALPRRQLLFGHFLYYSGLANWRTIARVLAWQRIERPRIGELGRRFGIFDQDDIATILHNRQHRRPFGETARMLGMLSEQQLRMLIYQQQRLQKKFGTILLEKNLINDYELQELLLQFENHNTAIHAERRD